MTMSEEQLKRRLIYISRPKTSVAGETYAAIILRLFIMVHEL